MSSETATKNVYRDFIRAVARDIESLNKEFPQLKKFSAARDCDEERLTIGYDHKTHRSERRAGWASGVPNPDPDGIWFYIDLHEPGSMAQIHTQPFVIPLCFREKNVMFLILEGKQTRDVAGRIHAILEKHGARVCQRPETGKF